MKYEKLDKKIIKEYNKIRHKKSHKLLCHAPFKSLLFWQYGQILACFYNKKEPLGYYPENSIDEIWYGSKIKTLRKFLKNHDLNYGCEDCKRYLQQGFYYSSGSWKYDYLLHNIQDKPISLDFQISNICNLNCIMCSGEYSSTVRINREKELPHINPYDDNFIQQIAPYIPYLKETSFTGGETFLIPIYYKIWEEIYRLNPKSIVSVTTNGTILDEKVINILSKLNFNITISIDSVNKQTYEYIRRNATFEKTMQNFEYFYEYTRKKNTLLSVKICPMRKNAFELYDIFTFFNNKDIPVIFNNVVYPPDCALWNLDALSLNKIHLALSEYINFNTTSFVQKANHERYINLLSQLKGWIAHSEKRATELTSLSSDSLMQEIIKNITDYILANEYYDSDLKIEKINHFTGFVIEMFKDLTNHPNYKNALHYFLCLPVDRFVAEIEIRDIIRLKERAKQACKPD